MQMAHGHPGACSEGPVSREGVINGEDDSSIHHVPGYTTHKLNLTLPSGGENHSLLKTGRPRQNKGRRLSGVAQRVARLGSEPKPIRFMFSKCCRLSGLAPSASAGAMERGHPRLREPERAGHRAGTDLSRELGPPAAFRQANP